MPGGNPQHNGVSTYNTTGVGNGTQWTFRPADQDVTGSSHKNLDGLLVGPDGTIYSLLRNLSYAGSDGLFAINPDGTVKWFSTWAAGGPNTFGNNMAIGPDGTIYCIVNIASQPDPDPVTGGRGINYDYHIRAIDPVNGSLMWEYISPTKQITSQTQLVIGPNGGLLFVDLVPGGGSERSLYFSDVVPRQVAIINLHPNGSLAWSTPLSVLGSSIAVSTNGTIHGLSSQGYMYALSPSGAILWNVTVPNRGDVRSLSLDDGGNIYVVMSDNELDKYDANGTMDWSYAPTDVELYHLPVIDGQGNIYLAFSNITRIGTSGEVRITPGLMSLDPDGLVRWTMRQEAGQMAMSTDEILYVATADHFIALRPDGSTLWQMDVMHPPSPINSFLQGGGKYVAIGPGGAVYFLGDLWVINEDQGYIVAIRGTPSSSDPGLNEQLMIPLIAVAAMSILLVILYLVKRRNGGWDHQ